MRPQSRNGFRIAIICALAVEFDAIEDSFDEHYNFTDYGKQRGDANFYRTGRIGKHNIVLACLPEMGKRNAASIASALQISFAKIELALLVGICGGVPFPSPDTDILLGDVIISTKVIEYDFGKQYPGGFQLKGDFMETIGRADREIRSILSILNTKRIKAEFQERHLCHLVDLQKSRNTWRYPGIEKDRLFKAKYLHKHHGQVSETGHVCALCQSSQDFICDEALKSDCDVLGCTGEVVHRDRLNQLDPRPRIHLGSLASGDTVMKSAEHRDKLAEKTKVSGFEMEGAAICDSLRCLIIKGVSDYSDSHKNNIWQSYASATAASCAKAFLEVLPATIQEDPSCLSIDLGPPKARDAQCHESSHTMDDTPSEESNYQWKISSMTSSINNIDHHIMSLQEEMRRLNDITNPFLREVLVSAVAETIKNNSNAFSKEPKKTRSFRNSLTRFRFGTIVSQTQNVKRSITTNGESSMQYETITSFIFYPASWLMKIGLKYGIEATTTSSKTGWEYSISSVRAVRDDSLIFRFCESGNVDAVCELLKTEASVKDVNSDGWTPLHFATLNGHFELAKLLISQGADRTALVYKNDYSDCLTPASLINGASARAIEMMLLFDDIIEFHGPQSDGWAILNASDWISYPQLGSDAREVMDVLSFLFHKYRTDIPDYIDIPTVHYCLSNAAYLPNAGCLRLMLDSIPVEIQDYVWDEPAVFFIARQPHIHKDISQLYFDRGADIHRVHFGETAFSLSLWLSRWFPKWCDRLKDNDQDLSNLIIQETSPGSVLRQVNWRSDTLMDFISLMSKVKSEFYDEDGPSDGICCDECGESDDIIDDEPVMLIEPWWEELKYLMKTKQCICSLLPAKCACGRSSDCWGTKSSVGLDGEYAYNYSLCRFCQKIYPDKSFESREADQVMTDTSFVNSDWAYDENMDKSWMRYGKVLESLRLFHLQNGKWNGHYHPREYYCSPCLILREQIYLDLTASAAES